MKVVTELRRQRSLKGIEQLELMKISGVSNSRISLIENGWWNPTAKEKAKLSKALRIPQKKLFPEGR